MTRRKRHEEHTNHEAWAIPYGDLVTLLMALFVVLYAISVVDTGKYRVLSNSLVEAFGARIPVAPIQVGDPTLALEPLSDEVLRSLAPVDLGALSNSGQALDPLSPTDVAIESKLDAVVAQDRSSILSEISEMSKEMESALEPLIEEGNIQVKRKPYWLEITINTSLLFTSGSATLEAAARPALAEVAKLLVKRDARIHVEGHTDNLPIRNSIYPSNWELSSGRAATVVNLFAQNGVDPKRMVAIGYAEFQPLTGNETEAGRAQNRRVAVIVLPNPPAPSSSSAAPEPAPERLRSDYEGVGRIR